MFSSEALIIVSCTVMGLQKKHSKFQARSASEVCERGRVERGELECPIAVKGQSI